MTAEYSYSPPKEETSLIAPVEYPSWTERVDLLDPETRNAAEAATFQAVIKACSSLSKENLPSLIHDNPLVDRRTLKQRHIGFMLDGLVAKYFADSGDFSLKKRYKAHHTNASILLNQVDEVAEEVEQERNRIFFEAADWSDSEKKKALKSGSDAVKHLPRAYRNSLYELGSEDFRYKTRGEKFKDELKTLETTAILTATVDGPSQGIGISAGTVDPIPTDNKYALGAFIVASYIPYVLTLNKLRKLNMASLEKGGGGLNTPSRRVYESWRGPGRRLAAHTAFYSYSVYKEWPYLLAALGVQGLSGDASATSAYLVGANLTAAEAVHLQNSTIEEINENGSGNVKDLTSRVARKEIRNGKAKIKEFKRRITLSKKHSESVPPYPLESKTLFEKESSNINV